MNLALLIGLVSVAEFGQCTWEVVFELLPIVAHAPLVGAETWLGAETATNHEGLVQHLEGEFALVELAHLQFMVSQIDVIVRELYLREQACHIRIN